MCFRPAGLEGGLSIKCPDCGKTVNPMGDVLLKKCPYCKADFTPFIEEYEAKMANSAVEAPKAPKAPAPRAPAAPSGRKPAAPAASE